MVYSLESCALVGLEPHTVLCEVDLALQLPTLSLIGLPSQVTQESRERIRAAVVNSGFEWPARKVTINLLPACLPKWGSHFELTMALGVLAASHPEAMLENVFAVGELSLRGKIRPCGWLPAISNWLAQYANTKENTLLVLAHEEDIQDLVTSNPDLPKFCELAPCENLSEAFEHLKEASLRVPQRKNNPKKNMLPFIPSPTLKTLAQVKGESLGIIAALVALAKQHHCLFVGSYGMGKSMLIRAICEAMPSLSFAQAATRQALLKTFGEIFYLTEMENRFPRPTVHLQTSITRAALEGALLYSGQVLPGELTRAHFGVLVADEFLEFRRDVIESLRQPLEEGVIRLQRARFRSIMPSQFQFLASTNLCPCGHFGGNSKLCRCAPFQRQEYQTRLSGPLMDRFDLIIMVGRQDGQELHIPLDLKPMVDELLIPEKWKNRLELAWKKFQPENVPLSSLEPIPCFKNLPMRLSKRGTQKLLLVAGTLATLLEQPLSLRHLRLAALLRQDLNLIFKQKLQELSDKNKRYPVNFDKYRQ